MMVRLFIGFEIGEEVKRSLLKLIKDLKRKRWKVRWVGEGQLHGTTNFIGWVEEKKVKEIRSVFEGVRGLAVGAFFLKVDRLGVFPPVAERSSVRGRPLHQTVQGRVDFGRPRVIWVGFSGEVGKLLKLQKYSKKKFLEAGFEQEEREYVPHLTLGRTERRCGAKERAEMGRQLGKMEIGDLGEFRIEKLILYQSLLKREGAEYLELAAVDLG